MVQIRAYNFDSKTIYHNLRLQSFPTTNYQINSRHFLLYCPLRVGLTWKVVKFHNNALQVSKKQFTTILSECELNINIMLMVTFSDKKKIDRLRNAKKGLYKQHHRKG